MNEKFKLGHKINIKHKLTGQIVEGRITGYWEDERPAQPTQGANVCVTYQLDKLQFTRWVNEREFETYFPGSSNAKME